MALPPTGRLLPVTRDFGSRQPVRGKEIRLGSAKIAAIIVASIVLVLNIAVGASAAPPWSDAPDEWWVGTYGKSATQIATVADGYPDGTFRPTDEVTRGQFAKMAVNGLTVATADPVVATFSDVPRGSTFFTYVEGAYTAGLVAGYPGAGGAQYRPAGAITRQQTNSILGRYLSQMEISTTGVIRGVGSFVYGSLDLWYAAEGGFYVNGFWDAGSVATDHKAATAYLVYRGVVLGSCGYLSPTAGLSRAQAAVMVLRAAAAGADMAMLPLAPRDVTVTPAGSGNDATPQVSGRAIPGSPIVVYDTFGGTTTKLTDATTNAAGMFYADLTTPLADGTHSFTAKVKNAAGLMSAASEPVTYVLDTVAPTGAISSPSIPNDQLDAAVNLAKPPFAAVATDERSGVRSVEFQCSVKQPILEWQTISTDTTRDADTGAFVAEWPADGALSAGLADGQYVFRVVITDSAGNTFIPAAVSVTVDTKPPTAQIVPGTLPPNAGDIHYTESGMPEFGVKAHDVSGGDPGTLASGVAKVEFLYAPSLSDCREWSGFTLISSRPGDSGFAVYPTAGLPDGDYLFAVRSIDRAGNESLLTTGSPATYVPEVARRVVIDRQAPVIEIHTPRGGELVPDAMDYTISWTVTDVSPSATVAIEYSADNGVTWTMIDAAAPSAAGAAGSYVWTVPAFTGADHTGYKIRISAVDKAGAPVGDVAVHTGVATTAPFTVYGAPVAVTALRGSDPDNTETAVDGRDFNASWSVSVSPYVVLQRVFLLEEGQALNLVTEPVDVPVASYADNRTSVWSGDDTLTADSRGVALQPGGYKIYVVVSDPAGRIAIAESSPFVVATP